MRILLAAAMLALACGCARSENREPAGTDVAVMDQDPSSGIGLAVVVCQETMPDGTIKRTLPDAANDDCVDEAVWLRKSWQLDQSMPRHCRELPPLKEGQTSQPSCGNTEGVRWVARDDDRCYLADQPNGCQRGDAVWLGTTCWGDAPQPPIPADVKDWPFPYTCDGVSYGR